MGSRGRPGTQNVSILPSPIEIRKGFSHGAISGVSPATSPSRIGKISLYLHRRDGGVTIQMAGEKTRHCLRRKKACLSLRCCRLSATFWQGCWIWLRGKPGWNTHTTKASTKFVPNPFWRSTGATQLIAHVSGRSQGDGETERQRQPESRRAGGPERHRRDTETRQRIDTPVARHVPPGRGGTIRAEA